MTSQFLRPILLSLALLAGSTTPASASCTQADIAGTWSLYISAFENDRGLAGWGRSVLMFRKNGTASPTGSTCKLELLLGGALHKDVLHVKSGMLALTSRSACTYRGTLRWKKVSWTDKIVEATLSRDKLTLIGVGRSSDLADTFTVMATKR